MNRKADYSRPEMEVLRFGDRTIITNSFCESRNGVRITVMPSFITFGSSYPQGGATAGDFAIGVQTFGQEC